ncbi:MAG: efflux RND transporter periplasmic adaptor subunit [Verrucomicrobiota bacterium]
MSDHKPKFRPIYIIPPILLIIFAFAIIGIGVSLMPKPKEAEREEILARVETFTATPSTLTLEVESQGTVQARTETTLLAEVSGRVETISSALYAGGFFQKGDVLVTVDNTDYKANLAAAKSRLADATLAYEQEKANSQQAYDDWKELGQGEATDLTLRKPQLERAAANLEAARTAVAMAERDLNRTQVKAPYEGRVREKFVDIGQMVNARASQIARIYSVDTAEIRLPLPLNQIQHINLPETYRDAKSSETKPKVVIEANYAGETVSWHGLIDRTEGVVDPRTRLINAIAQIEKPFDKSANKNRPPLKIGLFVEARIQGKSIENAYAIPRRALKQNREVYIIKPDDTLEIREVTVHKTDENTAIITDGLSPNDRLCLTPLEYAVEGMSVIVVGEQESGDRKQETES